MEAVNQFERVPAERGLTPSRFSTSTAKVEAAVLAAEWRELFAHLRARSLLILQRGFVFAGNLGKPVPYLDSPI
jgi:hypothetical protein